MDIKRKADMEINIAISLNQKYYEYTYVMLTSLFENNKEHCVHVWVLHNDLEDVSLEGFSKLAGTYGNQIHELKIERAMFPDNLPTNDQWTIEAYFRLAMLDVVPIDVERILYIDVDTIVNKDVGELYQTEFEGSLFVVCREEAAEQPADNCRWEIFRPLFAQGAHYFNSGVMLWNMKALRKNYCLDSYLKVAEELDYNFIAPDQDILNYVHWNQVKYVNQQRYNLYARLASNWGMTYESVKESASIVHYTGTKPWNADGVHYGIERLWWDYAKKTPYYEKLCQDFVNKSMVDTTVVNYIQQLLNENEELRTNLNESLDINQKLLAYLQMGK